ncbi:MAG: Glyoxylate/hydroxypyruvate reductase A [Paracidovorax wautersii]|uniref:Glyoxylate/hydroxypyruvate reductase A n=1 Tax=Paracidovorax wautersii TaxID=1177982 RepID=A0A7V8FMR6_9BURK|nr:MAG: Glyoxylate/hydroxypyruvate reductase A [Paracidovorax wautersii]
MAPHPTCHNPKSVMPEPTSNTGGNTPSPTIALLSTTLDTAYLLPAFQQTFPNARLILGGRAQTEADLGPLDAIDMVVCWKPQAGLMQRMPGLRLIQSIGAGVDHITDDASLPSVPVCRIVDPDMASGMTAYVCWAVTHHQRAMHSYLQSQRDAAWQQQAVIPASSHRVGIAGLGALGTHCARALAAIGYAVRGWSRSPKTEPMPGVDCFYGPDQLGDFLAGCDTLICLLPLTAETHGILDARLFAQLPHGAHLINVGRGDHLVEADLLQALDSGQLAAATLDAFSTEPLPTSHAFWRHPHITVTPHIATRTSPAAIARQARLNYEAVLADRQPPGLVDTARGY